MKKTKKRTIKEAKKLHGESLTWHVLKIYRKRCLLISKSSRLKHALSNSDFVVANSDLDRAVGSLSALLNGVERDDCTDEPNLEALNSSAIFETGR